MSPNSLTNSPSHPMDNGKFRFTEDTTQSKHNNPSLKTKKQQKPIHQMNFPCLHFSLNHQQNSAPNPIPSPQCSLFILSYNMAWDIAIQSLIIRHHFYNFHPSIIIYNKIASVTSTKDTFNSKFYLYILFF